MENATENANAAPLDYSPYGTFAQQLSVLSDSLLGAQKIEDKAHREAMFKDIAESGTLRFFCDEICQAVAECCLSNKIEWRNFGNPKTDREMTPRYEALASLSHAMKSLEEDGPKNPRTYQLLILIGQSGLTGWMNDILRFAVILYCEEKGVETLCLCKDCLAERAKTIM